MISVAVGIQAFTGSPFLRKAAALKLDSELQTKVLEPTGGLVLQWQMIVGASIRQCQNRSAATAYDSLTRETMACRKPCWINICSSREQMV